MSETFYEKLTELSYQRPIPRVYGYVNVRSAEYLKDHLETPPDTITKIDFRGGYYSAAGLKVIAEWLKEQSLELKKIILKSSQITEKSLPTIKEMLTQFPEVIIDLTNNPISLKQLRAYFPNECRIIFKI